MQQHAQFARGCVNIQKRKRALSYVGLSNHYLHCPVDITQCKHKRIALYAHRHNAATRTALHPEARPLSHGARAAQKPRCAVLCPRSTRAETRGQKTDKCTLRGCTARRTSETSGRGPAARRPCTYRGGPWAMHKQGPVSERAATYPVETTRKRHLSIVSSAYCQAHIVKRILPSTVPHSITA